MKLARLLMALLSAIGLTAISFSACTEEDGPQYATEFTVVDLDPEASAPFQLAVQACAGLHNGRLGGSIYIRSSESDAEWLEELELEPAGVAGAVDFLDACLAAFPKCVRYTYDDQQELLPSILTAAAALEALPLDDGLGTVCDKVVFDATAEFESRNTPLLATRYVYENYIEQTTGLAMLNPGYLIDAEDLSNPPMTREMSPAMVDFVFSKKLFVHFLVNGCGAGEPENELLQDIVDNGPWPHPIGVYGYNDSWLIQGYVHEAQSRCLDSRNMGAIPTKTGNLSFFSTRRPQIVEPNTLQQNDPEDVVYDPAKTYVAFVIGDGDNVQFIMNTRNVWLRQRLADCDQVDNSCAPITWSISPHLPTIAPDVIEWYYELSHQTGKDYFTLPPSGHLYAYPTSLTDQEQDLFVAATEQDARILDVETTVHWDWFESWEQAEERFLPKYAHADGVVRGFFPVNVPYMVEAFPGWPDDQFFKVLVGSDGTEVVVFRPRQWRGINDDENPFFLSPPSMAEELGGYPPGTVTGVYMTSDGGLSLENSFMELVRLLPPHVELVSADTAARLALGAAAN